jgi:DNA-binding transcriptional ArsR family regulator
MPGKNFYKLHSEICKTMANPKRLEVLNCLRKGEMTVSQLVEKTGISQANLSQHLGMMRSSGILSSRREGIHIFYKLTNFKIVQAVDLISEVMRDTISDQSRTLDEAASDRD